MGDLQVWSLQSDDILIEERLFPFLSSSSSSSSNPHPLSIDVDSWLIADQTSGKIIRRIQPTAVSEQRRKEVIDYVQRLIRGYLGAEVFPFGSVPLKTYLPDGDIDLTALSSQTIEDTLANDVRAVLEGEEQNKTSEFEVKDVQYIHAEVKLVKCLVENIVVDISFNQLGGLCTLCFLEQVDRLIGKDHLFKRSIILIKAWCYYESRILGAHHGLISTYALETLVLYIFHLFHASLNGPLAVLYRFLDYFSKFDWDNQCVNLKAPVFISSLPEIAAETPEIANGDLLLSKDFLKSCLDMFSVPSRSPETNSRAFPQKYLNIVDPLKENNNLGRSVNKGNFYRIRSAFTYGARKLGQILLLPGESMANELNKFFMNNLDRHGGGQRLDVQVPVPAFGANESASASAGIETCTEDEAVPEFSSVDSSRIAEEFVFDPQEFLCEGIGNIRISGTESNLKPRIANKPGRRSMKVVSSVISDADDSASASAISGLRLAGDAKDLATSRIRGSRIANETAKSSPGESEMGASSLGIAHHAPHLYFHPTFTENWNKENGNSEQTKPSTSGIPENKVRPGVSQALEEDTIVVSWQDSEESQLVANNKSYSYSNDERSVGSTNGFSDSCPVAYPAKDLFLGYGEKDAARTGGSPDALDSLPNLSGDYESHLESLQYGLWCQDSALNTRALPFPPPLPSQFLNRTPWDILRQSMLYKRSAFSQMNANGVVPGQAFYPVNPSIVSGAAFGVEEMPKPRGTGTYFPNTNHHRSYRERPLPGRGRNQAPAAHGRLQRPHYNGRAAIRPETSSFDQGSCELSQAQFPLLPSRGKPVSSDVHQFSHLALNGSCHANGFSLPPERLEFGSIGHLPVGRPSLEGRSRQQPDSQVSMPSLLTPAMQMPRPVMDMNEERVAVASYLHKDEDFPPLSL